MVLSYAEEIMSIYCHLSTVQERDRQTDRGTVASIAIGKIASQRCRLKAFIISVVFVRTYLFYFVQRGLNIHLYVE